MEKELKGDVCYTIIKDDFPDEFQCCICLDLLYKPVVVACGHLACFWCIHKSMDWRGESRCPVCRHPYNHFPRICRLMLLILRKLYASAYSRREKQVIEEERKSGNVSQQFDGLKSDSVSFEVQSDPPKIEDRESTMTAKLSSKTAEDVVMSDLTCAICKQLLCRPVVLNCGDVCCEDCIINSNDEICKCPVCQSPHPNGFPNVCWVLQQFLEQQFSEEYASRTESSLEQNKDNERPLRGPKKRAHCSSSADGRMLKVHNAGCDYCGMCPIIGKRYRCKDCKERMGFDLCEGCYNSGSKLPGRFNQQHTEDHQFEIMESRRLTSYK